jgi:cytochrome b subunit of formate dehydrogenase
MDFLKWGLDPWNREVLIRASWDLLWVSAIGGLLFLVAHAVWFRYFANASHAHDAAAAAAARQLEARLPERIDRHSMGARLFHGVMALSMFVLLFTAFLPIVGVQFAWVTWHWIAGLVLTASILFHLVHATVVLDFWSIWPDKIDMQDSVRRMKRGMGQSAPAPRKFAKYPMENKLYHLVITITGLAAIVTGLFMMVRVETPIFVRDPYLFTDRTWGFMYLFHGLAGIGLVALVMAHVYFALRPEKLWITNSIIFGSIDRKHFAEHHDPARWRVPLQPPPPEPAQEKKIAV